MHKSVPGAVAPLGTPLGGARLADAGEEDDETVRHGARTRAMLRHSSVRDLPGSEIR